MEIEQLRLILEQVNTLGGSAQETFIWWLLMTKIPALIFGIAWTIIAAVTLMVGLRLVRISLAGTKLMKAAGVYLIWSPSELKRAEKILEEHFGE